MTAPDGQQELHRCERGPNCTAYEWLDRTGRQEKAGAPCDRLLCAACETATAEALKAAPNLYVELRNAALIRGGAVLSEQVTRSKAFPLGINGRPFHLAEDLHWLVCAWADEVISTAGRPSPDREGQNEGQQTDDACDLLARYLSVWVAHGPVEFQITRSNGDPNDPKAQPTDETVTFEQAGWEACGQLIDWHHNAEKALNKPLLIHYPPEPCPACNEPRVLKRKDGDNKVTCTNCGKAWTLAMYETFVHAWIGVA